MRHATITIDLSNAEFEDHTREIARILEETAYMLRNFGFPGGRTLTAEGCKVPLRDLNGNIVGEFAVK